MRPCLALLALLLAIGGVNASAQTSEADLLRARVRDLERTVADLEAKLRALESQTPSAACGTAPVAAPATAWQDPVCWERLRKGMSRFEVLRLLGEPGKVSAYEGFERWEYPAALGARVNFDDRGDVVNWTPPEAASEAR